MKFFLEPEGWPCEIESAPAGLLARVRKGKMLLYFKKSPEHIEPLTVFDLTGHKTTITGTVTPVKLRTEK